MMMKVVEVDVDDDADLSQQQDFPQGGNGRPFPTQNVRVEDVKLQFFLLAVVMTRVGYVPVGVGKKL